MKRLPHLTVPLAFVVGAAGASIDSGFNAGSLYITVNAPTTSAVVTVEAGIVKVNGVDIIGGPVNAAEVSDLSVNVFSSGTTVDLSAVIPDAFPLLGGVNHFLFASSCVIQGSGVNDTVNFNSGSNLTFNGNGGYDTVGVGPGFGNIAFDGSDSNNQVVLYAGFGAAEDMITMETTADGRTILAHGGTNIVARNIAAVQSYLGDGNDSFTVTAAAMVSSPPTIYFVGDGGDDTLDARNFIGNAVAYTNRSAAAQNDRAYAPSTTGELTYNFFLNGSGSALAIEYSIDGADQVVSITGGTVGTARFDRAARILVDADNVGDDTFTALAPPPATLGSVQFRGRGGNDTATFIMTAHTEFIMDGADGNDTLNVDRNGFAATNDGVSLVYAPGAASFSYFSVEDVQLTGIAPKPTATPTPSPTDSPSPTATQTPTATATPTVTPTASPSPTPSATAEAILALLLRRSDDPTGTNTNGDGVVDAADLL